MKATLDLLEGDEVRIRSQFTETVIGTVVVMGKGNEIPRLPQMDDQFVAVAQQSFIDHGVARIALLLIEPSSIFESAYILWALEIGDEWFDIHFRRLVLEKISE